MQRGREQAPIYLAFVQEFLERIEGVVELEGIWTCQSAHDFLAIHLQKDPSLVSVFRLIEWSREATHVLHGKIQDILGSQFRLMKTELSLIANRKEKQNIIWQSPSWRDLPAGRR